MDQRRGGRGRKHRRGQGLLTGAFTPPGTNEAIASLQALQEDLEAPDRLDADIASHIDVRTADTITELFLSSVDDASTPDFALARLRKYFRDAADPGHPGSDTYLQLRLHDSGLLPAQAVLSARAGPRRGTALVEVASRAVAELFCGASYHVRGRGGDVAAAERGGGGGGGPWGGINCAPPHRPPRWVNIKVNRQRRRDSRGACDETMREVGVVRVSFVDLDVREGMRGGERGGPGTRRGRAGTVYPARMLWETNIKSACADLKTRCFELEQFDPKPGTEYLAKLSLDLRTIKHAAVYELDAAPPPQPRPAPPRHTRTSDTGAIVIDGDAEGDSDVEVAPARCLALRLRRPPTLETAAVPRAEDAVVQAALDAIQAAQAKAAAFETSTDVSTVEAFASPTACFCLHFDSSAALRECQELLCELRICMRDMRVVTLRGSRHAEVCGGISHELPALAPLQPLTAQDLAAAGDSEFALSFLLDMLLVHGHLRAADVKGVLGMLRQLRAWGLVKSYVQFLEGFARDAPAFHACNDGDTVMTRVQAMHAREVRRRRSQGGAALRTAQGAAASGPAPAQRSPAPPQPPQRHGSCLPQNLRAPQHAAPPPPQPQQGRSAAQQRAGACPGEPRLGLVGAEADAWRQCGLKRPYACTVRGLGGASSAVVIESDGIRQGAGGGVEGNNGELSNNKNDGARMVQFEELGIRKKRVLGAPAIGEGATGARAMPVLDLACAAVADRHGVYMHAGAGADTVAAASSGEGRAAGPVHDAAMHAVTRVAAAGAGLRSGAVFDVTDDAETRQVDTCMRGVAHAGKGSDGSSVFDVSDQSPVAAAAAAGSAAAVVALESLPDTPTTASKASTTAALEIEQVGMVDTCGQPAVNPAEAQVHVVEVSGDEGSGTDEEPEEVETGMISPRRAAVTPLRVLLYLGEPEISNRILRRYSRFSDRFLRVSFADERLGACSHKDLSPAVCERIHSLLLQGLTAGSRRFRFLAFSTSQLREHGCWLYSECGREADGAPSADAIRQSIGDLSALRTPAKFAARLGQAFSTTYETFRFKAWELCDIPDVTARNGELFSDGVGVITGAGMQKVVNLLPRRFQRVLGGALPSAIQIRLGGCKGMLVLWDDVPGMRPGALVGVRPSMKKFESEDLAVEVCAVARPMPAAINRQLIMALLSLGVDSSVFMRKYHDRVQGLDKLVHDKPEALKLLRTMGAHASHGVRGVGVAQGSLAACMLEAGISPQQDVLLLSMCQAVRTFALHAITRKCRIMLEDGINLIGVMDESGTLPAGTFWAQWDRTRGRQTPGNSDGRPDMAVLPPGTRAIVSRFPLISPADVRVLRAADPATLSPALTALTNVIVFPRVGTPEPCKMSGGDLDGDIYLLTWDPELIPPREAAAVDYTPAQKAEDVRESVTVRDIVQFQVNYMKNDQLARIAIAHLAIADFAEEDGVRVYADNHKCHKLVQLHSTAVDFAKTGVPVQHRDVSRVTENTQVPDYLPGGWDGSTTVIGEITRDAKRRTATSAQVLQPADALTGRLLQHADPELLLPRSRVFRRDAELLLEDWTRDVARLMQRFGVFDVGEVFSGKVREFRCRTAGKEKQAEHQKQLDMALAALAERYQRDWFPGVQADEVAVRLDADLHADLLRLADGPGYTGDWSAQPRRRPLQLEPGTLPEMFCAASALYEAAYRPDTRLWMQQHLIRRACPWQVAPRLLLQLKAWKQRVAQQAAGPVRAVSQPGHGTGQRYDLTERRGEEGTGNDVSGARGAGRAGEVHATKGQAGGPAHAARGQQLVAGSSHAARGPHQAGAPAHAMRRQQLADSSAHAAGVAVQGDHAASATQNAPGECYVVRGDHQAAHPAHATTEVGQPGRGAGAAQHGSGQLHAGAGGQPAAGPARAGSTPRLAGRGTGGPQRASGHLHAAGSAQHTAGPAHAAGGAQQATSPSQRVPEARQADRAAGASQNTSGQLHASRGAQQAASAAHAVNVVKQLAPAVDAAQQDGESPVCSAQVAKEAAPVRPGQAVARAHAGRAATASQQASRPSAPQSESGRAAVSARAEGGPQQAALAVPDAQHAAGSARAVSNVQKAAHALPGAQQAAGTGPAVRGRQGHTSFVPDAQHAAGAARAVGDAQQAAHAVSHTQQAPAPTGAVCGEPQVHRPACATDGAHGGVHAECNASQHAAVAAQQAARPARPVNGLQQSECAVRSAEGAAGLRPAVQHMSGSTQHACAVHAVDVAQGPAGEGGAVNGAQRVSAGARQKGAEQQGLLGTLRNRLRTRQRAW